MEVNSFIKVGAFIFILLIGASLFLLYLHRKLKQRCRLLQRRIRFQEESFYSIHNEIHDNIGQMLSLAKLNLHIEDADLPKTVNDKINYSKELVGRAIIDLRGLDKHIKVSTNMRMKLKPQIKYKHTVTDNESE